MAKSGVAFGGRGGGGTKIQAVPPAHRVLKVPGPCLRALAEPATRLPEPSSSTTSIPVRRSSSSSRACSASRPLVCETISSTRKRV